MADRPTDEEIAKWQRYFAIECNNLAWRLAETAGRTPEQDAEMLHAAHAAALHWGAVGTAVNAARAELLLAQVHALLGDEPAASRYARRNMEFVQQHGAEDWEMAFAHAAMAHAAALRRDADAHSEHYARARALGDGLPGAEDRRIFQASFQHVPQSVP